jgi:hypothetical protein
MGIFTELGLLYAKFKPEKLMEHLKLFGKRVNIPRLIRVCEEQEHWKELVYLYIQVRTAAVQLACLRSSCTAHFCCRQCVLGVWWGRFSGI